MPELPEVETVRRVLEERLKGSTITAYELGRPTFYRRPPKAALAGLVGSTVEGVRRRGKYLILLLSGGKSLTLHLGMSGRVCLGGGGAHLRFRLVLGDAVVCFHDARRFGRVGCKLPRLGCEPLEPEFNGPSLFRALRARRAPIKAALMDQGIVAGLGNIYATEALFAAGLRPGRAAGSLSGADCARLAGAIKKVLSSAVALGGSTLADEAYRDPLGRAGGFQERTCVYGRTRGRCGHALKATRRPIAGRTSLYCPVCQR
ncbi:MAG: bifunctional DNA-formamidopyrimidine glycosylase/DNA-(apurinic or apyrimidinic site) lyase [Elusimicrobia bacterium]|nr:bifunctional DNA-formamidopyrimidine glycosylase/DNA-(apurinic or apyrimidinic site) lyase [Elusimicrobiota bacterium]MDE2236404.1 bifunctional DNA-formamidopyrimidine glycosylase/DNA-(apurinic or apyrimidinic site) lyase [Elusimicrobiota bacterium]MDE2425133.1 bifunctional DNA-formamidopyrimidine glycosylase/DNA-(apurinic or apyrimidinic site) lyase [Elusimicrobiota bacterium]